MCTCVCVSCDWGFVCSNEVVQPVKWRCQEWRDFESVTQNCNNHLNTVLSQTACCGANLVLCHWGYRESCSFLPMVVSWSSLELLAMGVRGRTEYATYLPLVVNNIPPSPVNRGIAVRRVSSVCIRSNRRGSYHHKALVWKYQIPQPMKFSAHAQSLYI